MTEEAKTKFNDQLRRKMSGEAPEEKPAAPEELIERAGAAIAALQDMIAQLAVTPASEGEEKKTK